MKAKVTLFVNNITTQQLISGTKAYFDLTYKQNPFTHLKLVYLSIFKQFRQGYVSIFRVHPEVP